jgi:signal transduction histidine kinase
LFSAFERAESARNLGSLGLGLVLARAIARAHGGDLDIESAGASGTLFRFSLPR